MNTQQSTDLKIKILTAIDSGLPFFFIYRTDDNTSHIITNADQQRLKYIPVILKGVLKEFKHKLVKIIHA